MGIELRDPLDKYVRAKIDKTKDVAIGYIASEPYQLHDPGNLPYGLEAPPDAWIWAVDVEIDGGVVKACPIATNNKDIFYADIGRAVQIKRIHNKWMVVGLAKVKMALKLVTYIQFEDGVPSVVREELQGKIYRRLAYDELGSIPGSYGIFPYGAVGEFDAEGRFVRLINQ